MRTSPRHTRIARYPMMLLLALAAFVPAARPAKAQALRFPEDSIKIGLVQRGFVPSPSTAIFAGTLLPSHRHRDLWAGPWFPHDPADRTDAATGTKATLFGGGRALAGGRFRHVAQAERGSPFDVSGHYLRGTDWPFADPVEERLRERSALLPARDDQLERWGADIRYDLRRDGSGGWLLQAGLDRLRGNQLTEVGSAYARSWTRWYGQARYGRGRLLADAHVRGRGAGEAFFHRTARDIEGQSLLFAGRLSHSTSVGDRHSFEYGVSARNTLPFTDGTVTGVYEADDDILIAGGHLRSLSRLAESLDLDALLRVESHSRAGGPSPSGRATLTFRPATGHGLRVSAERVAVMPSADNLVMDVTTGRMTAGAFIYDIVARGVPGSGFTFDDRCPGGFQDLCMRSPLAPGEKLPADPSLLWNTLVDIAAATDVLALWPLRSFFLDPEPGDLQPRLLLYNQKEWEAGRPPFLDGEVLGRPIAVRPVDPLQPMVAHTLSLRYDLSLPSARGAMPEAGEAGPGRISAEVWHSTIDNFIGPLRAETPTVFFDPASVRSFIERRVRPMVRLGIVYPGMEELLVHDLTNLVSQLPVGTIMPDQVTTPGLLLTYRNYGRVGVSGVNLSASVRLSPALTLRGDYRYVTEECFDFLAGVATDCSDLEDISLNVPKTRSGFAIRHGQPDSGLYAEARLRRQRGFHANAGVFAGDVEGYTVLDAQLRVPVPGLERASAGIMATNLLDDRHQEFVGAPEIGRLIVASLNYAFR